MIFIYLSLNQTRIDVRDIFFSVLRTSSVQLIQCTLWWSRHALSAQVIHTCSQILNLLLSWASLSTAGNNSPITTRSSLHGEQAVSRTRYAPTAVPSVEPFHINDVASTTRAIICLVILTFDLLTLKLVRVIARGGGNLAINFDVSASFHSRLMGQRVSYASSDLATLTFNILSSK